MHIVIAEDIEQKHTNNKFKKVGGKYRMYLCMDMNSDNGQVVYIKHTSNGENNKNFSKLTSSRDNGTITIGAILAIVKPHKIDE